MHLLLLERERERESRENAFRLSNHHPWLSCKHEEALVDAGLEGMFGTMGVTVHYLDVREGHIFLLLQVMSTNGMRLVKRHCGAWSKSTRESCMIRKTVSHETNTWIRSLENCVSFPCERNFNICGCCRGLLKPSPLFALLLYSSNPAKSRNQMPSGQ